MTGTVSLTNTFAGSLTITDGSISTTFSVTTGQPSATYSLTGLNSGTGSHTVTLTLSATTCGTVSATYTAPASCTVGVALSVTPGANQTPTNQYAITGTLSLTNAVAGTATFTDGAASTIVAVNAGATSVSYSLSGLSSGTGSHTVTVSYAGQTASATYTAPAASVITCVPPSLTALASSNAVCVGQPITLNTQVSAGGSFTVTAPVGVTLSSANATTITTGNLPTGVNTFTVTASNSPTCFTTATVSVTVNPAPVATLSSATICAGQSTTLTATGTGAGGTYVYSAAGGSGNTLTVSPAITTTYSVTATTSAGCSATATGTVTVTQLALVVTPGTCNTATNQYTLSGTVSLTNSPAGSLTTTDGTATTTLSVSAGQTSAPFSLPGLISGTNTHTVTVTSAGICPPVSAIYTAPAACTLTASLGNFVFADNNKNGIQDGGDTPLSGVVVTLLNGANSPIASTTTNAGGLYSFTGLSLGVPYSVSFTTPANYSATTANVGGDDAVDSDPVGGVTAQVTLTSGENNTTLDAGYILLVASLGDRVFVDANRDGQQGPVGQEPGIQGVTVSLLSSGTLVASTTTGVNGLYSFTGLTPGVPYSVSFTAPAGFTATLQNQGSDITDSDGNPATGLTGLYSLSANENNTTVDQGYYQSASLGNFVFADNNNNGVQDSGDTPLPDVTVTLVSNGTVVATTVTNAFGVYSFTGLTPGVPYSVSFTTPANYTASAPNVGGNDDLDSDPVGGITAPITLTSGQNDTSVDAGYSPPLGSIGDFVFIDLNRNGRQDAGEPGVNGVTVRLFRETTPGNYALALTTQTAGAGTYLFPNLSAGTYLVEFDKTTLPTGYSLSQNVNEPGVPDNLDSDADPVTGRTSPVTIVASNPDLRDIRTVDAGLVTDCPPALCVPVLVRRTP